MSEVADRIRTAAAALAELQPGVEAGEPWPLSPTYGAEPESDWGPREVLAHVAEMIPFWTGQIEAIVSAAQQPHPFGRVEADAERVGRIGRDRSLPIDELFGRIRASAATAAARFDALPADAHARRGMHVKRGEMTVAAIAERFIASHLEEHVTQLGALVDDRG